MEAITVVSNAAAGSSDDEALAAVVHELSAAAPIRLVKSSDTDELDRLLAEVTGPLVVAGGDGSLHSTVNSLHRQGRLRSVTLGLIPLGTGNDFARSVGLPLEDPAAAAAAFVLGVRRSVDLLVDEDGGVVVNAVHLGVGAEAGREAEPWKARLGKLGYLVGAVVAGVRAQGEAVRVLAGDRVLADGRRRVLQVAIGNGRYVGGGTDLVPEADPFDGCADVLVSFAVGRLDRLRYALRLRRGTHDADPDVVTARSDDVRIDGAEVWLNADGELLGPVSARRWVVRPGALSMQLPAPDVDPGGG